MGSILVAERTPDLAPKLRGPLLADGLAVERVGSGPAALERGRSTRYDLLVLQARLPGLTGLEVCRRLRGDCDVPIILVTSTGDEVDRIVGLELGADDYLTEPFSPSELLARIRAVLRRWRRTRPGGPIVELGPLRLDPARFSAELDGRPLELRPQEFKLLLALVRRPEAVLSREHLLDVAWGRPADLRTVDVHVAWLRRRLRGSGVAIETCWGKGYRLRACRPEGMSSLA